MACLKWPSFFLSFPLFSFFFWAPTSVFRLVTTTSTSFAPEQIGLTRTRLAPLCRPIWTLGISMNGHFAFEHPLLEAAKERVNTLIVSSVKWVIPTKGTGKCAFILTVSFSSPCCRVGESKREKNVRRNLILLRSGEVGQSTNWHKLHHHSA